MSYNVLFNPSFGDEQRRDALYGGELIVLAPNKPLLALVDHAREMLAAAFGPLDPRQAQHHMPVEEFHSVVAPLKPAFIHHPTSWRLIAEALVALGCDPEMTYLDVPRLRISTSHGYLTSGVAYAHHPHRDTWWASPLQQINWWLPIYPFNAKSGMAFHPEYWSEGVVNDSDRFNYYDWNNNQRKNAAQHITSDTRWQPHATQPLDKLQPAIVLVPEPASPILFSGAQMHSTVPNTAGFTRYSIDFRVINLMDVVERRGAPNVDSRPAGTSLRDFMRISDRARVPEEICALYEAERPPEGAELVFTPA